MNIEDEIARKLAEKAQKWSKIDEEHSYARLEYLKVKVIYDALLNLSISQTNLTPNLAVNKKKWIPVVQNALLNGKSVKLDQSLVQSLQEAVKNQLLDQCQTLMEHWDIEDYTQIPILVQNDIETVKESEHFDRQKKEIEQEMKRKKLLEKHVKITTELVQDHALGHVSELNKLNVRYYSDKKK